MWGLYDMQPSFVLGFHGCDATVAERVFKGNAGIAPSANLYDWLGNGIYFWEASPQRALEWAVNAKSQPSKSSTGKVIKPAVIGAVIDLGRCCNLFDSAALTELSEAWAILKLAHEEAGTPLPENKGPDSDRAARFRDRAVIEVMHEVRRRQGLPDYDTVRAAFGEGGLVYEGAGLTARNHIQIAVRNPDCIKGYFRPIARR